MSPAWLESVLQLAQGLSPLLATLLHVGIASAVTVHALLYKHEVHKAAGWIGLAWLAPVGGGLAYWVLGINRIRRVGVGLGLKAAWRGEPGSLDAFAVPEDGGLPELAGISRLTRHVTGKVLLAGNTVVALHNGDEAYPAMLAAIDGAQGSVTLLTYIFNNDLAGNAFVAALTRARLRGVQIRVLVDAVGARYRPTGMLGQLRASAIPCAAFLPPRLTRLLAHGNLRNHRKIMVVDGHLGFTGGMNISASHWLSTRPARPVQCLHFAVRGPVVTDMQRTFATDWAFSTGEKLHGGPWFIDSAPCGPVLARGVADGPDGDIDHTRQVILGALATARRRVRIVTPYFLPDEVLLTTLRVTAMRGVAVDIVLPGRSNLPLLDWAMRPQCGGLVASGCRVHLSGPPFDHAKLFLIDDAWSLIGSTNWDARSLRLNFEYNMECHDAQLVQELDVLVDDRIRRAHQLSVAELARQPIAGRLRDRMVWLLSPYL